MSGITRRREARQKRIKKEPDDAAPSIARTLSSPTNPSKRRRRNETPPSSSTFIRKLGSDIVKIEVGPDKQEFYVHRNLLSNSAKVFDRMLKGGFREANTDVSELQEDDADVFELFIEWCYKDRLPPPNEESSTEDCEKRVRLFCFAEKYGVSALMNDSIDFISTYLRKRGHLGIEWSSYVYTNTAEGSPLRDFMSRYFCHRLLYHTGTGRWQTEKFKEAALDSPDLLQDVFSHLRDQIPSSKVGHFNPVNDSPCDYHLHDRDDVINCRCSSKKPESANSRDVLDYLRRHPEWDSDYYGSPYRGFINVFSEILHMSLTDTQNAVDELVTLGILQWAGNDKRSFSLPPGRTIAQL